jgi:predicted GNAT family acetyltransferase
MIVFTLKSGLPAMDFDKVTGMLKEVWWSPGIGKTEVMQGARNSAVVVGAFTAENEQIGYARAISDKTRMAYIMDVVVDDRYRKQGIGRTMVKHILEHPDLKDVYQWLLMTKDAHGVYSGIGFSPMAHPDKWMEIRNDRPER